MDGDIYSWKPGRQARKGFVEGGDWFSFGHAEYRVILRHPGDDVQEVIGNKKQELTRDTGDENRPVSEQHRRISRSRSYRTRIGPRMGSWVTSSI